MKSLLLHYMKEMGCGDEWSASVQHIPYLTLTYSNTHLCGSPPSNLHLHILYTSSPHPLYILSTSSPHPLYILSTSSPHPLHILSASCIQYTVVTNQLKYIFLWSCINTWPPYEILERALIQYWFVPLSIRKGARGSNKKGQGEFEKEVFLSIDSNFKGAWGNVCRLCCTFLSFPLLSPPIPAHTVSLVLMWQCWILLERPLLSSMR